MAKVTDLSAVEVRFDGLRFGFWQKVAIRSSVDDLCASVQLAIARPGTGSDLNLTANTVADVLIDDGLVTRVRPDLVRRTVGSTSHSIDFQARSLGRELVDCQYSITLSGLKLGEIVKRICSTFKVPVKIETETAVVPDFSMQCELPANALINAVRAADLLLYPHADGGLVLTKPTSSAPVTTLQYGVNIKHYSVVDEHRLRFSDYVVKGYDYDSNAALKGAKKDEGIGYFRPMHIMADRYSQATGGCDRRATLERNRRQARAHRIEIVTPGWRYLDGSGNWQAWEINTQVRVIIPEEDIDAVFLIGEREFRLDDKDGPETVMQVMDRAAFVGEEKKKSKRGAGVKK